jgi:ATP-binding cassette subfamily F protein 3
LGTFLFSGDDVVKQVGVLSGGEKSRLALARMLIDPAGLLLLDEPTNHLDMDSRDVLTEALRQFAGSVVFISHDRRLINAIGTKVVEVHEGTLAAYPGDWEYYQWKRSTEQGRGEKPAASTERAAAESAAAPTPTSTAQAAPSGGRPTASLHHKERKELGSRHRKVEKRIMEAEERQKELASTMSDPANASDHEVLAMASSEAASLADELAALYEEWTQLGEVLGKAAE